MFNSVRPAACGLRQSIVISKMCASRIRTRVCPLRVTRFVHWATAARPIDFMLCSVFMSSWQRIIDSAFAFTKVVQYEPIKPTHSFYFSYGLRPAAKYEPAFTPVSRRNMNLGRVRYHSVVLIDEPRDGIAPVWRFQRWSLFWNLPANNWRIYPAESSWLVCRCLLSIIRVSFTFLSHHGLKQYFMK